MKNEGEYRAYVIGIDGHFISTNEFVATDDETAFECARQFVNGHGVELWSGGRLVAKLKAEQPSRD
jgi:hypothetical protein